MAYSRLAKVIGGTLGAGLFGYGCYHSASRVRQHVNKQDADNIENAKSGTPEVSSSSSRFQYTIEVGLTAARFAYDVYDKLFRELQEIRDDADDNVVIQNQAVNQIPPYDPGAGGDAGEDAPLPAQREKNGSGDAPQFAQPLAVLGEGAPPPF